MDEWAAFSNNLNEYDPASNNGEPIDVRSGSIPVFGKRMPAAIALKKY
jgi:hypothetical protein